jgi:hypothetical protein
MPVFASLQSDSVLQNLGLQQILQFLRLASLLKDDILLCQPGHVSAESAPEFLPPSIAGFLADATGIPLEQVDHCWDSLRDDAWDYPSTETIAQEDEKAFIDHGWARGLCESRLIYAHSILY